MTGEFSARAVTMQVLAHLERRRVTLVEDAGGDDVVRAEVARALEPVRAAYRESELPPVFLAALEREIGETVPARWRALASPFTALEKRSFGAWRGGDLVSRIVLVFAGLTIGGICVALPFIPIWEKWFPFALAIAAWWLPDGQAAWHRRRYGRQLGRIVRDLDGAQKRLESAVTLGELLPTAKDEVASKDAVAAKDPVAR